jgi:hypothetical protein
MRGIGPADSAQKRGKSAKICEFSGKFIHSFSRNLVLLFTKGLNTQPSGRSLSLPDLQIIVT